MKTELTKVKADNEEGYVLTDVNSGEKDWSKKVKEETPEPDKEAPKKKK